MPLAQPADHRLTPNVLAADHAPEAGCLVHPSNTTAVYWRDRCRDAETDLYGWRLCALRLTGEVRDLAKRDLGTISAALAIGILAGLAISHAFNLWG